MIPSKKLIRFDWAMKRILRDKANFGVLEGFLTVLLNEKIKIKSILGSQGNKETHDDKYNDVDILIENSKRELVIVEVQNVKEHDYFHRILYGSSKIITEYIQEGDAYAQVKKIISITIAYFDLGQGLDYVYHGTTTFRGFHHGDILNLSQRQRELYKKMSVHQIYPEYWIIKAGLFDKEQVNDQLDEWIYFFKTGEVKDGFTAAGLKQAKVKLDRMKLSEVERVEYEAYLERLRRIASRETNEMADINDAIEKVRKEEAAKLEEVRKEEAAKLDKALQRAEAALTKQMQETIIALHENGIAPAVIAQSLKLSLDEVNRMIEQQRGT